MRVLIVGLGSIAHKHIYALNQLSADTEIYALRSGATGNKTDGVTDLYTLTDNSVQFDFAIISNPTSAHNDTIEQLLPLGIPLFIEKPLFHTLEKGQEVLDKCNELGIKTYVACNLRFNPIIRFVREYLGQTTAQINEVNIYTGSYLPDWRPQRDFRTIYSAIPELGGGVHLDLIHELDYACWLFGLPLSSQKKLTNKSSLDIPAIDFAHYNLEYPAFTANLTLNYYRRDTKRELEILFEDATLVADLVGGSVKRNGEIIFQQKTEVYYTYIEQMKYFLAYIKGQDLPMNNINEAFEILKICLK
ncbi:putative dehydrogenase [Chitinophaga dinghuensis]|uniref:Putative dehydrogenase n=1 Tax=Chitinophaga dinghuensis TaxID=1539050 RepID=A0A327W5N1_9BACT|nr:Gfo/Idh/MocA family oxidoreductase [Chitinophaga dinghuensis]RAJ85807.1 putative dehydrogenase [Chitinophaga dinghuensis]